MLSRKRLRSLLRPALAGAGLLLAAPAGAWAEPPPWTPAYGGTQQFQAAYRQFDASAYAQSTYDYGIAASTCDRDAVSALVGGQGDGSAASAGVIQGALVGHRVGQNMDQVDQYCTGQALERAEEFQAVSWTNPDTGARYNVAGTGFYQSGGRFCRGFVTRIIIDDRIDIYEGQACRSPEGIWQTVEQS